MNRVTSSQRHGMREYQEDRQLVTYHDLEGGDTAVLMAILDGHGGSDVAEFAMNHLREHLKLTSLDNCVQNLRDYFDELNNVTSKNKCGSTLSVACVFEKQRQVVTATLGDSPIMIGDETGLHFLSVEHNVGTNADERERVTNLGAVYSNGYMLNEFGDALQLTRALGDCSFENYLSREPEITIESLSEKSVAIVCSDGFLDPGHGNTRQMARASIPHTLSVVDADELMTWRYDTYGKYHDNATVLLYK